ncbi:hypothetical protein EDD16DRAFT_1895783 [Pisolithus croceorrhizus]|nr:hypothetical protein EDD16DRAFT_1895783 [Pisolithus croceorrhizus]
MPTLSPSFDIPMEYIAKQGIGSVIVFEYLYFLLQVNEANQHDVATHFTMAIKKYHISGVQAKVIALIATAFQEHGEDVEILCTNLVDIAKEHQMSKQLLE